MNRKNKEKISEEFKQLRNKLFIKTMVIFLGATLVVLGIYVFALDGNFANVIVSLIASIVGDSDRALEIYYVVIRSKLYILAPITIILLFLIALRIYLKEFIKYFNEINSGIDALIVENSKDVELSPELIVVEKKINSIKHTLEQRKLATEVAEKRKNDLVVYLAHDLKTPLTSVIGYLTLLRDENKISEELREKYLSISLEKAERLEDLINEFFEITRFNLSGITLKFSRVNLTRLLEQLTFEFKPMLIEKNLQCELEIQPGLTVKCDVDKIQRVFDNLLRNAVNYSFEDSTVRIVAIQEDDFIRIQFINSGNTIPEEKLVHIFEQFYRLDTARSSKSGGAGLGLAIAKEIVELHGGCINARSENEIIEFEVSIPI